MNWERTSNNNYKFMEIEIEETVMHYGDYVGIAHQIMAMEFGWA